MTSNVLKGKTALITGSGRNIGRAIALKLASAGFTVVINGSRVYLRMSVYALLLTDEYPPFTLQG